MDDLLAGQVKAPKALDMTDTSPMEGFNNTGNGNGDRFASRNMGKVLLYSTGKSSTFYSVGPRGRWLRNEGKDAGDVQRRCRDVVEEMRGRSWAMMDEALAADDKALAEKASALLKWAYASDKLGMMDDMARTGCLTHAMVVTPDEVFDADMSLLATPSKMLVLSKDGVAVRDIDQDDMVTYSTGVDYDPAILEAEAVPLLMKEYFETFMPEPARQKMFFKALGTALLGGNSHRLLLILKGQSTTGKTQLVEAIRDALGDYAGSGTPSIFRGNLDDKARPDVLRLLKKRVAFLPEASKSWELHADRVKALTGGDAVTVRRMRSDDFLEVIPHFTPVIYTNEMPRINGADKALKRRMLVIDFERTPEVEDALVKQRFLASVEVRRYLLAALVRGYLESLEEGIKDVQQAFAQLTTDAFDDTTHLGEFFAWLRDGEHLREAGEGEDFPKSHCATLKAMHERYQYWVKQHGNTQDKKDGLNYREFNEQLRSNYGWVSIKTNGARWEGRMLKDLVLSGFTV